MTSREIFNKFSIDPDDLKKDQSYNLRGKHLSQLFSYLNNLTQENYEETSPLTIVVLDDKVLNEEDLIVSFFSDQETRVEYWTTLTELDREQTIALRVERKIVSHLSGDKDGVEGLVKMIEKFYPEYMYAGIGYRAVSLKNDREFSLEKVVPFSSWSINPIGREGFVKNDLDLTLEHSGFGIHKIRIVDLEADIIGVSLIRLIKEKFNHLSKDVMINRFFKEDEVIAREIININKVEPRIKE